MEKLKELSSTELEKINGGSLLKWILSYNYKTSKFIYVSLNGAYQEGFDNAVRNCS
jgi:bacteriocin-like protein